MTGAAGGLGSSLCRLLAKEYPVLAISKNQETLLNLQKELPSITIFPCDLIKKPLEAALAIQEFRADGLINNAGLGYYGPFHKLSAIEIEETLALKITSITTLLRELIPFWIKQNTPATIVNIASGAALLPYPYFATYSAANRFLLHFSQSLYDELVDYGIASLCFCPGSIKTAFAHKASHGSYTDNPPMALCPEKCAQAILWQIKKQKPYLIYDLRYRSLISLMRLLPRKWRAHLMKQSVLPRFTDT